MKHSHKPSLVISFCLAMTILGCSYKPERELDLAQKAMEQAKEQHAAEFAPGDWKNAMDAWEDAQSMMKQQRYSQAQAILLRAKGRFERARDISKGRRNDVLRETQGLQKAIELRYKSLKGYIDLNKAKLSAARKQSLEDACQDIDKGIGKLKAELDQGEYTQARTTAQTTVRQVYEAEKELRGYLGGKKP